MLFNTPLFVFFFFAFFVVFSFVARTRGQKLAWVTFSSFVFYGAWDYRFVPLLFGTGVIDFLFARGIENAAEQSRKKLYLIGSIAANLGVLGFFKYFNFFLDSLNGILSFAGIDARFPGISIVLPIGLSFYTFQSMSYTIDVYRGHLKARKNLIEYLSAISFFPHLVCGPIVRASTLFPQFEEFKSPTWAQVQRGFLLIATGLVKKSVADLLSMTVNGMFPGHGVPSLLSSWTGTLAFAGQIFGDFSGYSDIAIGIALLIGIELPRNFNLPYIATSPSDFWQRWHISLSTWIRDYLYIPLGGNRKGPVRTKINLMIAMCLSGLWHGANWTFMVWGAFHGLFLIGAGLLKDQAERLFPGRFTGVKTRIFSIAITFYFVCIAWVIFRADSFGRIIEIVKGMHGMGPASDFSRDNVVLLFMTVLAIVFFNLLTWVCDTLNSWESEKKPLVLWPSAALFISMGMMIAGPSNAFVYFQF